MRNFVVDPDVGKKNNKATEVPEPLKRKNFSRKPSETKGMCKMGISERMFKEISLVWIIV